MIPLFPYQIFGADWLAKRNHALLADEMGLGKSAQTIRAADHLRLKKILVICPAIARINWLREFGRWSIYKRNFFILEELRDICFQDCQISSYDYALANAKFLAQPWDLVVIDEIHFLKSVGAKRAKAILGSGSLAHTSKRVWALSGTPAPNHAGELWILLYTFGVTKLKYQDFLNRYCDQASTSFGWKVVGTKAAAIPELRNLLDRVMLRRKKAQVLTELPPIFFSDVVVNPGFVQMDQAMTEAVALESAHFGRTLEVIERQDNQTAMRMLEALAQSVSTLMRYTGLQKVEPAVELVKMELELGLYEKIVIFAVHKQVVHGISAGLPGSLVITGDTSAKDRQLAMDRFQNDPTAKILIGNIKAAGTAITLTAAHQELFVEKSFVPGDNAQAAMRCHRIGQTHFVTARFLTLANALDEKVTRILRKKTSELTALLG